MYRRTQGTDMASLDLISNNYNSETSRFVMSDQGAYIRVAV